MPNISIQNFAKTWYQTSSILIFGVLCLAAHAFATMVPPDEFQIQKCWEYKVEGSERLASDGAAVYFVRDGAFIEAVSAESGEKIWSSDVGGVVDSNLLVTGGSVIFMRRSVAIGDGKVESVILQALSSATGVTKWSAPAAGDSGFTISVSGENVLSLSLNGSVQAFAAADGTSKWKRHLTGTTAIGLFFLSDNLWVAAGTEIQRFPLNDSDSATIIKSKYEVSSVGSANGESIVWGDKRGNLVRYSTSSGKVVWQFKSGGTISDIVVDGSRIYASSDDNFVYAISTESGKRHWKKRVGGRVAALSIVDGETLMVRPIGDENIILLNTRTGKVKGQISRDPGEILTGAFVRSYNRIILLTDRALYSYGVDGCVGK